MIIGGIIRGFLNNGTIGAAPTLNAYYTHLATVILAALMALTLIKSGSVSGAFNIVFTIISLAVFGGLFLVAFISAQDGTLSPIARSIVIAGRTCISLCLLLMLTVHTGPQFCIRMVILEALYVCVEAIAALTSYLLVPALAMFLNVELSDYVFVCSLGVAFMLVITMYVFLFNKPVLITPPENQLHDTRCQIAAQKYNLTERESQVLNLVARGYSVKKISETLVIAENTVQSYIKVIYRKMDVHKKQDLIDYIAGIDTSNQR